LRICAKTRSQAREPALPASVAAYHPLKNTTMKKNRNSYFWIRIREAAKLNQSHVQLGRETE
jgi:hypothetical protein